jgi:para-nitrobenzyl esterase
VKRFFLFLTLAAILSAADSGPVVTVTGGRVRGAMLEKGRGAVFKGVPYAQPPVGELRWREPVPLKPWTGVREAAAFGPVCAQLPGIVPNAAEISREDCLYLNVWTPEWPSGPSQPVMVWIPGGGNSAGGSSQPQFDGEPLAGRGIILVTVNYRLGSFGFFAHPALTSESPHHASGNQGILDQIAALKWVRANIAGFGGDPKNVTPFGESAGSLDVSVLMTSPLAKGLFVRAIGESGAVILLGDPLTLHPAEQRGVEFAARWKVPPGASLQDLRAVPSATILATEPTPRPPGCPIWGLRLMATSSRNRPNRRSRPGESNGSRSCWETIRANRFRGWRLHKISPARSDKHTVRWRRRHKRCMWVRPIRSMGHQRNSGLQTRPFDVPLWPS